MNKRIKLLAEQAGFVGENMYPVFGTCQETALKNFAELIVKDCINKVDEVGYKSSNNISADDTELFKNVLKKHFGVEE